MIVVQKYGGSSVGSVEKLKRVAELVVAKKRAGCEVVACVSAMGDTTDELLSLAKETCRSPPSRELDMLLSCGERITMALLAMAISELGEQAVSLTGSQSGIITNDHHFAAKIIEVRPFRVEDELRKGRIVIVAGYQGMSYKREVTTLGRGGTDTTAVALAAALGAEACEIYSDVDGVLSADPRLVPDARTLPELSYSEMLAFSGAGARVLNAQAVAFAQQAKIKIHAKNTSDADAAGTLIAQSPKRARPVAGVARKQGVWLVSLPRSSYVRLSSLTQGYRAATDHVSGTGGEVTAWLDLENTTDEAGLRQELTALGGKVVVADSVSVIGQDLLADAQMAPAFVASAPAAAPLALNPHLLCVAVQSDQSTALVKHLHATFCL